VSSVRTLSSYSGYGTLIVPQWPLAYFWPFLHDSSSQFKSFVKGVFELPSLEDLLLEANLNHGLQQIMRSLSVLNTTEMLPFFLQINRLFPSYFLPLLQNESLCKTFHVRKSLICMK